MADSAQTYTDLRSVEQYRKLLRNLHTLNAAESHATLVRMLEGLLASPLGPEEQLEVLESARQTITFVQHEMSSRYAAHPLPHPVSRPGHHRIFPRPPHRTAGRVESRACGLSRSGTRRHHP